MSVATALVAGSVVGVGHALEADHLAAVATLVDDEGTGRDGLVGASWGVGHALPVVALGVTFVALGVRLPESVTTLFEAIVGVALVVLGARMLADVLDIVESHAHDDVGVHRHLRVGPLSVGGSHRHLDADGMAIGVLHGLAGSGALVVALVSAAPTFDAAVAFLASFSLLSVLTMAAVSALWGRTLGTGLANYLKGGAGVVGVAVGVRLVVASVGALPV